MFIHRSRRTEVKSIIVSTLFADKSPLNPVRLRRLVESKLGKPIPDGTWYGTIKRLLGEGLLTDSSAGVGAAEVEALIERLTDSTYVPPTAVLSLTRTGRLVALALDLAAMAAPSKRAAAERGVDQLVALAVAG